MAFRRLIAGPALEASPDTRSLLDVCIAAIKRFSPATLQSRRTQPTDQWYIPEAALQDEMYRCLFQELDRSVILSEYSHTRSGRVDFLVDDKKWGIELLQNGTEGDILEHSNRFGSSGKYHRWGVIKDYIIINFCSPATKRDLQDTGKITVFSFLR